MGGGVSENYANRFLLRMANLLIFIHNGGIWKLLYSPDLKKVLILLVTKVFQKGTFSKWVYQFHSHMRFHVTQWSAKRLYGSLSAHSCPLPLEQSPLGSPVKSPLGDSYSNRFTCLKRWKVNEATRLTSWIGGEWNSTANRTHWILPIEANEISEPKRSNEYNRKVYVIHCRCLKLISL